jgi:hypothetical protein
MSAVMVRMVQSVLGCKLIGDAPDPRATDLEFINLSFLKMLGANPS